MGFTFKRFSIGCTVADIDLERQYFVFIKMQTHDDKRLKRESVLFDLGVSTDLGR
jgi:hypothetical protein